MGCTTSQPELEISTPTPTEIPSLDSISHTNMYKRPQNLHYQQPKQYYPRNVHSDSSMTIQNDIVNEQSVVSSVNEQTVVSDSVSLEAIRHTLSSNRTVTSKSIVTLDTLMDMISSMQKKDINVFEEEWEYHSPQQVSKRTSLFYGDIFEMYEEGVSMDLKRTLGRLKQTDSFPTIIDSNSIDGSFPTIIDSNSVDVHDTFPTIIDSNSNYSDVHDRNRPMHRVHPRRCTFQPDRLPQPPTVHSPPIPLHTCAFCQSPIHDHPVSMMGRYWHKHHSQCHQCHRPLGLDNFAEINNVLYCEDHYCLVRGVPIVKLGGGPKSELEKELKEVEERRTVRKVRNMFMFMKLKRVDLVSVVEEERGDLRQRYVMSFIAPRSLESL
jgi:hypothetical protein